jgi:glucose-6-phosphate 1-dehydrogenase
VRIDGADMKFAYSDVFEAKPSTGYETLIYDCMMGDASLFQRADTIEAGWAVIQPILDAWERDRDIPLPIYEAGGMGPKEADDLLGCDGRRWRRIIR